MFTPLLDVLIVFTLTTPLVSLIGKRIGHKKIFTEAYTICSFSSALILLLILHPELLNKFEISVMYGCSTPSPEKICMKVDTLSIFMTIIFLIIGIASSIFSIYEIGREDVTGYYTALTGMVTAMVGVVSSDDLFTLFIFWEIMCICSYALVAFRKEQWESIEASYKYLIMSSAGSITILFALSLLYGLAGTLNMQYLSISLAEAKEEPLQYVALVMLIVGFGLQAGMFPFHTWLPDAHMAAPSPISAILSGIMVKTGVYGLIKILLTIYIPLYESWHIILAAFAISTMFVGNFSALLQDDIKRLLAFSTIANIGYIILGISINSETAITGSLFHALNHAVIKALLFLCTGTFIHKTGTRSLKDLAGIRRRMPITTTIFLIGILSLSSIPPLNLFWSELLTVTAGVEAGMPILSFLMIINMIFSAAYCLRIIQTVAIKEETPVSRKAEEASIMALTPTIMLCSLALLIGFYPSPFQTFAQNAAQTIIKLMRE